MGRVRSCFRCVTLLSDAPPLLGPSDLSRNFEFNRLGMNGVVVSLPIDQFEAKPSMTTWMPNLITNLRAYKCRRRRVPRSSTVRSTWLTSHVTKFRFNETT